MVLKLQHNNGIRGSGRSASVAVSGNASSGMSSLTSTCPVTEYVANCATTSKWMLYGGQRGQGQCVGNCRLSGEGGLPKPDRERAATLLVGSRRRLIQQVSFAGLDSQTTHMSNAGDTLRSCRGRTGTSSAAATVSRAHRWTGATTEARRRREALEFLEREKKDLTSFWCLGFFLTAAPLSSYYPQYCPSCWYFRHWAAYIHQDWTQIVGRVLLRSIRINSQELQKSAKICGKRQGLLRALLRYQAQASRARHQRNSRGTWLRRGC